MVTITIAMTYPDIHTRIQAFCSDLPNLTDDIVVQKYITFGESYVLPTDKYFGLKYEIARRFTLHPSQVVMVGSGKLGFSIKPTKRYTPFGDESDLDIAIISETLFNELWSSVFDYWRNNAAHFWATETQFKEYLFRGWIRPDFLPLSTKRSYQWFEFFRQLTLTGKFGPYKINAGVYKSWWYLERYQQTAVAKCRHPVEVIS